MLEKIKGLRKFLAALAAIIGTVVLRLADPTTPDYVYYGMWSVAIFFQHPRILIAILKSRGIIKDEFYKDEDESKNLVAIAKDKKLTEEEIRAQMESLSTETVDSDSGLVFSREKALKERNETGK